MKNNKEAKLPILYTNESPGQRKPNHKIAVFFWFVCSVEEEEKKGRWCLFLLLKINIVWLEKEKFKSSTKEKEIVSIENLKGAYVRTIIMNINNKRRKKKI